MPSLRYKDHYISVVELPDKSGKSSLILCVEIRHERDRVPPARLMLEQSASMVKDARAHGFATGKQWIDRQSADKSSVSALAGELPPVHLRLKSWLASLV
jgi:hypothetical protein